MSKKDGYLNGITSEKGSMFPAGAKLLINPSTASLLILTGVDLNGKNYEFLNSLITFQKLLEFKLGSSPSTNSLKLSLLLFLIIILVLLEALLYCSN